MTLIASLKNLIKRRTPANWTWVSAATNTPVTTQSPLQLGYLPVYISTKGDLKDQVETVLYPLTRVGSSSAPVQGDMERNYYILRIELGNGVTFYWDGYLVHPVEEAARIYFNRTA